MKRKSNKHFFKFFGKIFDFIGLLTSLVFLIIIGSGLYLLVISIFVTINEGSLGSKNLLSISVMLLGVAVGILCWFFAQRISKKDIVPTKVNADLIITKIENKRPTPSSKELSDQIRLDEELKKKTEMKKVIFKLLESFNFQKADSIYLENKDFLAGYVDELRLEELKAKLIQEYFRKGFVNEGLMEHPPDSEQAEAIGAFGQNILVSARAGSGKTATISAKVAFLCNKYDVKPEEILVLCFNSSAAENMRSKIVQLVPTFEKNARTFHSWASFIVKPERNSLLFDDKGEFSTKQYSNFIKELLEKFSSKNIDFKEEVYDFFRDEDEVLDESISETKHFENEQDRYLYLRNKTLITLKGDTVKSKGEKWIADFLFEHGIDYRYEQRLFAKELGDVEYHPDFTVFANGKKYIIEHWGINTESEEKRVPKHWRITWYEYKNEMEKKIRFFKENEQYAFIQTSIKDIEYYLPYSEQRQNFEDNLKEKLVREGIKCEKRLKIELVNTVWEKQLFTKMDLLIGQFIGWMQKLEWDKSYLENELSRGTYSSKQKHFCNIGLAIYEEYLKELNALGKIDFNMLVSQAACKIKTGEFDVSQYKYLLIDEFQDFSQLFQNLVDAIIEKNSQCNLFCVGDSWQLINGFAGSDRKYFEQFAQKSKFKEISTCYRSYRTIVDYGNAFADKYESVFRGQKSSYFESNQGEVKVCDINDIRIENDVRSRVIDDEFKKSFRVGDDGKEFLNYEFARYLKQCFSIVSQNTDKTFLFLYRKGKMNGMDLNDEFKNILLNLLKEKKVPLLITNNKEGSVKFKTMHSSKGLEADIVILLDACEKTIPSVHPSGELFEIFGRTSSEILNEEKRLFYVALTRAKERLYIVTNKHSRSEFIIDTTKTGNIISVDLE